MQLAGGHPECFCNFVPGGANCRLVEIAASVELTVDLRIGERDPLRQSVQASVAPLPTKQRGSAANCNHESSDQI